MTAPLYRIRITIGTRIDLRNRAQSRLGVPPTYIPKDIFETLPSHSVFVPTSTNRHPGTTKDYRHGPIRLDWVDFEAEMKALLAGKDKEEGALATTNATFVPSVPGSNSGSINVPEGIVHILRSSASGSTSSSSGTSGATPSPENIEEWDKVTVGVLAVPSWMTPSDFLAFVAPAAEGIKHLRMIRDSLPNRSIAILKFRTPEAASEFTEAYQGQQFSSIEPETVHVVRINGVTFTPPDTSNAWVDPSLSVSSAEPREIEMPTCPVCLERMDSSATGLVTIPCAHTFHCMCLSKWGDSRCPVCRYSQLRLASSSSGSGIGGSSTGPALLSSSASASACATCGAIEALWICLVCGSPGCGRYGGRGAHAHAHFVATGHTYSLELATQRVWDYAGDGYVHRLIQNRADGKLVELPPSATAGMSADGDGKGPSKKDAMSAEKMEAIGMEYSTLLHNQLESQREWYESRTAILQSELLELRTRMDHAERIRAEDEQRRANAEAARRAEDAERSTSAERDRARAEQRAQVAQDLARRLERELREERAVSAGLLQNLSAAKASAEAARAESAAAQVQVRDMEDQVRDIMFALEVQNRIAQGGDMGEAEGGSVVMPTASAPPSRISAKKKGRK